MVRMGPLRLSFSRTYQRGFILVPEALLGQEATSLGGTAKALHTDGILASWLSSASMEA